MKVYLLTFNSFSENINREVIQDFLESRSEILNWYGIMPNAILFVTDVNFTKITDLLIDRFGNDLFFLITKARRNHTHGYINAEVWSFINKPEPAKKLTGLAELARVMDSESR